MTGKLIFDHAALFLDYQNLFESLCKLVGHNRFQRPAHANLVQANTDLRGQFFIDAEVAECLQCIQIGFAGGDDTESGIIAIEFDAVEIIGARKRPGGINLVALQAFFLRHRRVGPADMHAVFGQFVVLGQYNFDAATVDVGRNRCIHVFGYRLQSDPAAAVA